VRQVGQRAGALIPNCDRVATPAISRRVVSWTKSSPSASARWETAASQR
jgi:hypothetical protein